MSDFVQSIIEEAGRIFGVRWAHLFDGRSQNRDAWVMEAESAVAYTLWVVQSWQLLAAHLEREIEIMPLVQRCVRMRNQTPKYSELVGDLVWFAQRTAMAGKVA